MSVVICELEKENEDEYEEEDEDGDFDDEITFTQEEFKEVNFVKTNTRSVTIKIPTKHANAWEEVLEKEVGNKCDRTATSNGTQYKTTNGVSITISDPLDACVSDESRV